MVSRVRVFIATTEGPSEIQHIIEEDAEVRSVVCLNGTSEALAISRDYESFVRKPTGVVERLFGHPSYRVDVSRCISTGRSWQLGLLAAHALQANGRLASRNQTADEVYLVSGEVRHSLDIMPVDHICDKLRQSQTLFDGLAHLQARLTVMVPQANVDEAAAEWRSLGLDHQDATLVGMAHWHDFPAGQGQGPAVPPRRRPWRKAGLILLAILSFAAVASLAGSWRKTGPETSAGLSPQAGQTVPQPQSEPRPLADATKRPADLPAMVVRAVEKRVSGGGGCGRLRLSNVSTVEADVASEPGGDFERRPAAGLCEVEFSVSNPSDRPRTAWICLSSTIEGAPVTASTETLLPGSSFAMKAVADPWGSGKPWTARLIVVADVPPATAAGWNFAASDVDSLVQRLETMEFKPRVVTFTAEGSKDPRFH